ncbi:dephospho-CoA kinase [Caldimonas taiwanensis]|uniref:dephospho-CoA kinase n=1 Tax=Caldimonas taiwanensis TaxID=307483 RepID=UPI000785923A|nr:dephospho-CoA kinase [Caldimonas taiwanensis]
MDGARLPRPRRLGLTGGIGSGKSTVAAWLRERGAHVVDTDAISRQLTQPGGAGIAPIRAAFGEAVLTADGALDRERMRERVFRDPQSKAMLEAILHPLIGEEALRQAAQAPPDQMVVFDVPLLVESRVWRTRVDQVLVVDCSPERQVLRVKQRSGLSEAAVRAIMVQQASRLQRLSAADIIVANDTDGLADLYAALEALWRLWHPMHPPAAAAASAF